jgi:hypothetical protein
MRRILAFAICGLTLGACSSSDIFKLEKEQVTLQLQSEPPGAEASVSTGGNCKTPCAVPIDPAAGNLTVTYTLQGYQPQQVGVEIIAAPDAREKPHANPNPVVAELEAVAKPPARRRAPARKKAAPAKKPAAQAAPRPAQPAPAAAAPPPPAAPAPAPAPASPWPPAPGQAPAQQ